MTLRPDRKLEGVDMKDLDGREIKLGDRVAVSRGGRYHRFYTAMVIKLTAKMVRVEPEGGGQASTINPGSCVIIGRKKAEPEFCLSGSKLKRQL